MIIQGTAEAKAVFARAGHCGYNSTELPFFDATLNGVFAIRRWAPLQILFIIDIGTCEEDLVSMQHISHGIFTFGVILTGTLALLQQGGPMTLRQQSDGSPWSGIVSVPPRLHL